MATQKIEIDFVTSVQKSLKSITAFQKKAGTSLDKIDKSAEKVSKQFSGMTSGVKLLGAAVASVFAGRALVNGIERIVDEAVALENAMTGLGAVANATGNDIKFVEDAAKDLAADGLIPLTNSSAALKNLLAAGLDGAKSLEVFKALRDSASFNRQGQLSLGEAIQRSTEGIKNQNSVLVDNAGITKNLSVIYKEYASSIGKTVGNLSEAEKVQAAYVGILKEAKLFQGNYNKLLLTFSGSISKVSGNWRFLLADLGEFITKSPKIVGAVNALGDGLKNLRKFINENRKEVGTFIADGLSGFIRGIGFVIDVIGDVTNAFLIFTNSISRGGLFIESFIEKTLVNFGFFKKQLLGIFKGNAFQKALDLQKKIVIDAIDEQNKALIQSEEKTLEERINLINKFKDSVVGITSKIASEASKTKIKIPLTVDTEKTQADLDEQLKGLNEKIKGSLGISIGEAISSVGQGAGGAKKIITGAAKAVGKIFGGAVGSEIAGAVIGPLMAAPEEFAKQVKEFFTSLPELIQNILINAINFEEMAAKGIEAFIDKVPDLTEAVISSFIARFSDPTFTARLALGIGKAFIQAAVVLPEAIVRGFRDGLNQIIPNLKNVFNVGKIVIDSIIEAFKNVPNFLSKLFKFDGGGKGPVEKFLHFDFPFVAFAKGGHVGGGSAPVRGDSLRNDTIPALLSPGEMVLPRSAMQGGSNGIVDFLKKMGVPGFGFGGFIKDTFNKIKSPFEKIFDNVFGGNLGGIFKDAAGALKNIYGGSPLDFLDDLKDLPTKAFGLFTDFTSDLGLPFVDLIGLGLPRDLIAAINSLVKRGANIDITDLIGKILKNPTNFIGETVKGLLPGFQGDFLKLLTPLENGGVIPNGFSNDNFPARLSSGEMVVDRTTTGNLQSFLKNDNKNENENIMIQLLSNISASLDQEQQIETSVNFNSDTLADIILNLNRNNARLS